MGHQTDRHLFLSLAIMIVVCAGCAGTPFPQEQVTTCFDTEHVEIRDEESGVAHPVYCLGKDKSKPPLLLLHELPGLSSETLSYAQTLSSDFTVYTPHLVGPFNWPDSAMHTRVAMLRGWFESTFDGQWSGLENGNSKVASWVRYLTTKISNYHGGLPISVIGNCLTGTLPLTLFANPSVNIQAVVMAQPALPRSFFNLFIIGDDKKSLGVADQEIKNALHSKVRIYGIRFQEDELSPFEKFERLRAEFKDHFIDAEICHDEYLNSASPASHRDAHSTLIGQFKTDSPMWNASRKRRDEVKEFLRTPGDFSRQSSNCRTGRR